MDWSAVSLHWYGIRQNCCSLLLCVSPSFPFFLLHSLSLSLSLSLFTNSPEYTWKALFQWTGCVLYTLAHACLTVEHLMMYDFRLSEIVHNCLPLRQEKFDGYSQFIKFEVAQQKNIVPRFLFMVLVQKRVDSIDHVSCLLRGFFFDLRLLH